LGSVAGEGVVELGDEGVAVRVGEGHECSAHDDVFHLAISISPQELVGTLSTLWPRTRS
jgi:hypothetical protein